MSEINQNHDFKDELLYLSPKPYLIDNGDLVALFNTRGANIMLENLLFIIFLYLKKWLCVLWLSETYSFTFALLKIKALYVTD